MLYAPNRAATDVHFLFGMREENEANGTVARLAPAILIVLMTVASWVGVFVAVRAAVLTAASSQASSVETISAAMGGR